MPFGVQFTVNEAYWDEYFYVSVGKNNYCNDESRFSESDFLKF
jgi:hypothetical protein